MTIEETPAQVFIADCELGRGVFAAKAFAEGETILRFTGQMIRYPDTVAKGDAEANPLQVGRDTYIDLEVPGVIVNHSCEPNAGIHGDVVLVALRPISLGEEIRYDYSTTMWEAPPTGRCLAGVGPRSVVAWLTNSRRFRLMCRSAICRWVSFSNLLSSGWLACKGAVDESVSRQIPLLH